MLRPSRLMCICIWPKTPDSFQRCIEMARSKSAISFRLMITLLLAASGIEPGQAAEAQAAHAYASLPLSFEANLGQTDARVKFLSRGRGYNLFLTPGEAVLVLSRGEGDRSQFNVLRMRLIGANPNPEIIGLDELPGKSNYFIGSDPGGWRINIPSYQKIVYRQVYPGIDLAFYGKQGKLEFDFVVFPGADPNAIVLEFRGAERLWIEDQGDLLVQISGNALRLQKPIIYQDLDGSRRPVEGRYRLREKHQVGFEAARYDESWPLIIDPILSYSTFLGGNGSADQGFGIAVDSSGSAYITGRTSSLNFPTRSPFQSAHGGADDIFVVKLSPDGSAIVYSTYLGGSRGESGNAIAVDSSGNAYVTGSTTSVDFPTTTGAFQTASGGGICRGDVPCDDAFAVRLNSTGSALLYSTFLGGSGSDSGAGIAVDPSGNAYVAGHTSSTNFPTANPLQPTLRGSIDAFVTKLNAMGTSLLYSTYLGGDGEDVAFGIAVGAAGDAYVTGGTASANFPVTSGSFQAIFAGISDAFVAKLNAQGSALVYSTYLGGSRGESGNAIAVDSSGNAYVTGNTGSTDFPTARALQPEFGGSRGGRIGTFIAGDAFVTKLNAQGSALVYSTYLGGGFGDTGAGIAVDSSGNAYVIGSTQSGGFGFPTVDPFQAGGFGGGFVDAFVAKLNASGSAFIYSSFFGGDGSDFGQSIAVDRSGNAYVTGFTSSANFPTAKPLQPVLMGADDVFIAKISDGVNLFFAQFANGVFGGGSFTSTLIVTSASRTSGAQVQVDLFKGDGSPMPIAFRQIGGGPTSSFSFALPPLGSKVFTTDGQGPPLSGFARISSDSPVGGVVVFSFPSFGSSGVGESQPLGAAILPVARDSQSGLNTGVALANPGSSSVSVDLVLRDPEGQELAGGRATVILPPRGHIARFIGGGDDSLFPNARTEEFQGTVTATVATAGARIVASAFRLAPGEFTTLPIVQLK